MTRITSPLETEKLSPSQVAKQVREQRRAEELRANLIKRKQWQQAQPTQASTKDLISNTVSPSESTDQQPHVNVKG